MPSRCQHHGRDVKKYVHGRNEAAAACAASLGFLAMAVVDIFVNLLGDICDEQARPARELEVAWTILGSDLPNS